MNWAWHDWQALSPDLLHAIFRLRSEVFVVEQNCVFQDLDGRDPACEHLCGTLDGMLVAYLRLVPPGVRLADVSIGRVVVRAAHRGQGYGRAAMQEALRRCAQRYPGQPVVVSAQRHLEGLYAGLGFSVCGEPYVEDGIPHVDLRLEP